MIWSRLEIQQEVPRSPYFHFVLIGELDCKFFFYDMNIAFWNDSSNALLLFMHFITCFCLRVLIQVYHLLQLHFRNQKSSAHPKKKKSEGGGLRVVYAGSSAWSNWCSSIIGNGTRRIFPSPLGEIIQIYSLSNSNNVPASACLLWWSW